MANVNPLKLEFDGDGNPSGIGELLDSEFIGGSSLNITLSSLRDMSSINPVDGNSIVFDGTDWTASTATADLDPDILLDIQSVSGTVSTTSGGWESTKTGFNASSAGWNNISGTVTDSSAGWEAGLDPNTLADLQSVSGTVLNTSGGWNSASSTLYGTSGGWESTKTGFNVSSAGWNNISGAVTDGSAGWEAGLDPNTLADLQSVSGTVLNTSGGWNSASSTLYGTSEGWNSASSTIYSTSDNWVDVYTQINTTSGTALLTGATPQLSNPLDCNYTNVARINTIADITLMSDVTSISGISNISGYENSNLNIKNQNQILLSGGGDLGIRSTSKVNLISNTVIDMSAGATYAIRTPTSTWAGNLAASATSWDSGHTTLTETSAGWNSASATLLNTSSNWNDAYSTDLFPSAIGHAGWTTTKTTVDTGSSNWDSVYTSINDTSAGWMGVSSTVFDSSGGWEAGGGGSLSGTASAIGVVAPGGISSIAISGFESGDGTDNIIEHNHRLLYSSGLDRWITQKSPWILLDNGDATPTTDGQNFDFGGGSIEGTTLDITTRDIKIGNDLSAHVNATVQFDPSTITVSSCPVPPPFAYVQTNTTLNAVTTSDKYYFASGIDPTGLSIVEKDPAHITWDTTNHYFTIANPGYYQFEMGGSFTVASSPTTITIKIMETTGLGGTESDKNTLEQVIRTNIDPHTGSIRWIGYIGTGGVNYTCSIQGSANNTLQVGSSFSCKRIG